MVALSGYKDLWMITPYPEGSGGQILNDNFRIIGDLLESGNNRVTGYLTEISQDTTPQLGGPLDLTYSCIIYNAVGSGIYIGGPSGSLLFGEDGLDYRTYDWNYALTQRPKYQLNWQYIDGSYPGNRTYGEPTGLMITDIRNSVLGGLNNKIFYKSDVTTDYGPNFWKTDRNVIVGGYDNSIVASGKSLFVYQTDTPHCHNQNVVLGGYNNTLYDGKNTVCLATNNVNTSGITDETFFTGNSPFTATRRSISHGIYPIQGVRGGISEREFFLWGDNPQRVDTGYTHGVYPPPPQSGLIVDGFGCARYKNPSDRFVRVGGDLPDVGGVSSYELFCAISASGEDGQIHTAAWPPIHLKMFNTRMSIFQFGIQSDTNIPVLTQSGITVTSWGTDSSNYVTNLFMESGYYGLDSSNLYWYPSRYNNGLSGLLTIYMEDSNDIMNYYGSEYYTKDEYNSIGTSPHSGTNMIVQFRLYDGTFEGFRAAVWGRGMSMRNMFYGQSTY